MIQNYSVESVIADVGWLTGEEERAVREILGDGASVYFDEASHEIHLCWRTMADTFDDAIDISRGTLREAAAATGVYSPHRSFYAVREINQ